MADVLLSVAGRSYRLACRDGEEEALRAAARELDARAAALQQALGVLTESRLLLMAGLQLVAELEEVDRGGAPGPGAAPGLDPETLAQALETLADRLERIAGLPAADDPGAGQGLEPRAPGP